MVRQPRDMWGGDRRRNYGDRRWKGRGGFGDDTVRGGERFNDNQQNDQEGRQRVHSRRTRRNKVQRGVENVNIASRSRKPVLENKNIVLFFFSNFSDRFKARDKYDIFFDFGRVLKVVFPARMDGR